MLGILAGGMLGSCTNENDLGFNNNSGSMLIKAPEVIAYSGNHYWNDGTRSANVNGNLWYQDWDRPTNVTQEEIQKVLDKVKDPIHEENTIKIDWENYWVQQVWKGTTEYSDHYNKDRGKGSDLMDQLHAWSDKAEVWWPEHTFGGYEHVNNFNSGNNQTTYTDDENHYVYEGTTLMTGMNAELVDAQHQFAYKNSADGGQLYFDYIIVEVDGEYYVCFDFFADNRDNPTATANKDHYIDRDYIYNDWIVKITPAYRKGTTPDKPDVTDPVDPNPNPDPTDPTEPEQPEDAVCENCGHSMASHARASNAFGFVCGLEECEDPFCHVDEDGHAVQDGPAGVDKHTDEVEVNLHATNKNRQYLESHLSIHVRSVTDVEILIPVPAEYYCKADDMAIVLEHKDNFMVHGGPAKTEFKIGENIVTLNVAFMPEGIRIWTDGINEDVINYCRDNYGDGITFEVWNYFNDVLSLDELKGYLNQATVKFLDALPAFYINAFTKTEDGSVQPDDCTVSIEESQADSYSDPQTGTHLNASPHNEKYSRK